MTARHEAVLRALLPVPMGGADPAILSAEAGLLDAAQDHLAEVFGDVFVSSTTQLARFETVYGLSGEGDISTRRARILAAMAATGGLSRQHFIDVASSLGYTITIARGVTPFRAGINAAGDQVKDVNSLSPTPPIQDPPGWDPSISGPYCPDLWVWTVTVTSLGSNSDSGALKTKFLSLRPADTSIRWIEGSVTSNLGYS